MVGGEIVMKNKSKYVRVLEEQSTRVVPDASVVKVPRPRADEDFGLEDDGVTDYEDPKK